MQAHEPNRSREGDQARPVAPDRSNPKMSLGEMHCVQICNVEGFQVPAQFVGTAIWKLGRNSEFIDIITSHCHFQKRPPTKETMGGGGLIGKGESTAHLRTQT